MSSDTDREQGLELGDLDDRLRSIDYPAGVETVREAVGDHEIEHAQGQTTVGEALRGQEGATFESVEGVLEAVKTGVGGDAVGREGYSDRGGADPGRPTDESF